MATVPVKKTSLASSTSSGEPGEALEKIVVDSRTKHNKRRHREELSTSDLTRVFEDAFDSKPTAELVVLHLIDHYKFDLSQILTKLQDRGLDVSFSKVDFASIAPLVGLAPGGGLRDAPTFEIRRARIPTALFKSIINDMHIMLNQYGPPQDHSNEETRSRFLAPLLNRIVAEFNLMIQNTPECIMPGRMTTKGRVEYQFKVCGGLTVLFVEVKLRIGSSTERMNAIAQVIAEADACDFMNSKINFSTPINAILCDGDSFEFYIFDGRNQPPVFSRGVIRRLIGPDIASLKISPFENSLPQDFITSLRPICETFHAIFISGYIAGLKAYHQRSLLEAAKEGRPRVSTPAWVVAIKFAIESQQKSLAAAALAETNPGRANCLVDEAFAALKESVASAPATYRREDCNLMAGWDDSFQTRT